MTESHRCEDGFSLFLIIDVLISDSGSGSEDEIEDASIQSEKISRLEAAQKRARIDIAVKGIRAKTQQRTPVVLSPLRRKVPKKKNADSLMDSSVEDEEEEMEEIMTEGVRKSLLSPTKKAPKKQLLSPVKKNAGAKISTMFPDPASWPYNLTKEAVDQMTLKDFLKAKELALQEKQLKATEKDIPGNIMETTVLTLPPVEAVGGHHDFLKILCPASMLHMPLGDPADWWQLVPVEWPLVTGKTRVWRTILF